MYRYIAIILALLACSCSQSTDVETAMVEEEEETTLPRQHLELVDLTAFAEQDGNWTIGSSVSSNPDIEHDLSVEEGVGLLVNVPSENQQSNLYTSWEHGDIELKFDVLMPKGSNSGVYLQGRYEVQLLDSWGKDKAGSGDMGGIYQRWDDTKPEGQQGYEGYPPKTNAALAPGLWQTMHLLFKAPKFDEAGNKVEDARFDWVELNGHRIHEYVSVTGPTRGAPFAEEAASGPIMIQGDHGPVALRNIEYKRFSADTLTLDRMRYEVFTGKWDSLPDFSTLTATEEGEIDVMDLEQVSSQPDHYGVKFTGTLSVSTAGDYLFETNIDDGGELYIDSILVVHNDGDPGRGRAFGKVNLTEGTHKFTMTYYQQVWSADLKLYYEGPGIERRSLASIVELTPWQRSQNAAPRVYIDSIQEPTLLRGFVNHGKNKLTHSICIGHPSGMHYAYDLLNGNMVKSWKGEFLDVTNMWRGRGNTQLAMPLNASIQFAGGLPLARLSNPSAAWPLFKPDDFRYQGYSVGEDQMPTFSYSVYGVDVKDYVRPIPEDGTLERTLDFSSAGSESNLYFKLDQAPSIAIMENGLYNIGGKYYVQSDKALEVRQLENQDELVVSLEDAEKFSYKILW